MRELAERAIASSHWRWMPGMAVVCLGRDGLTCGRLADVGGLVVIDQAGRRAAFAHAEYSGRFVEAGDLDAFDLLPDLDDPGTQGCLLWLVREAWGDSEACVMRRSGSWTLHTVDPMAPYFTGSTEAEALVAALECAPCAS